MGAEVFVTINTVTGEPVMTELLSGEAFSLKYYRRYADQVEAEIARLGVPLRFRRAEYCRMFVIGGDVCFLLFPDDSEPSVRGTRKLLRDDDAGVIAAYVEGDELVCVDGWLQTEVPERGEWVLVAEPVDEE